mgnify:CR=1 FL=1
MFRFRNRKNHKMRGIKNTMKRIIAIITLMVTMTAMSFAFPSETFAATAAKETSGTELMNVAKCSAYLLTTTKAVIKWSRVRGADGYLIYRVNAADGTKVRIKKIKSPSVSSYTINGITPGSTSRYKINAYAASSENRTAAASTKAKSSTAADNTAEVTIRTPKVLKWSTPGFKKTNSYKVIKTARTKLGCRYVWGASGPNRFDCSGFTCWTMNNCGLAGTKTYRMSSRGLYHAYNGYCGKGRNLSNAQPGDILIIGYGGSASHIFHVGIYYGNGNYIHANGHRVKIGDVPDNMVVAILRMPALQ